ncbi:MAG: ExeM/NucH family extracellular endonuclease [Actinomycetes bacterium]
MSQPAQHAPRSLPRAAISLLATLAVVATGLVAATPAQAVSSGLVISRVYGGGGNSGAYYKNDYVELVNRGTAAVSVAGWSVQYASATGAAWTVTPLGGRTVAPGQALLVQEAAGAGGTTGLPTPDVTDNIAMSGTAGKVALVSDSTALTCGACTGGSIVDLVGYGATATSFEGTGRAPAPSNTTQDSRLDNGCVDTDHNDADFVTQTANADNAPRNTASALHPCSTSGDTAPSVTGTTPDDKATGIARDSNLSVTFSEPVDLADGAVTLGCSGSGGHDVAVNGGPSTFTVDPGTDLAGAETCTATVVADKVTDRDGVDPAAMGSDYTFSFSTATVDACTTTFRHTYEIQGSGTSSPFADGNQVVTTQGVVVADFQATGQLGGFAIQAADGGDGNDATSDGLFVFGSAAPAVSVGDVVRVTGTVSEFQNQTELTYSSSRPFVTCGQVAPPPPTTVHLPEAVDGQLEQYEGMLVSIPEQLTVQQNFFQGRYGQLTLGYGGRLYQPTNQFPAGSADAKALADRNKKSMIVLDDASTFQNRNPIPYLGTDGVRRAGDSVTGVTGMLDEGAINSNTAIRDYRVQPTSQPTFSQDNTRPATPPTVGGNLKIGFANVLNYFTTTQAQNPDARGADTPEEFQRQQAKIVRNLAGINGDVIGLSEIENLPGTHAVQNLVDALNAYRDAPGAYAAVPDPTTGTGSDAIKVAMIYKPSQVTLVGGSVVSDPDPVNNRPPLAATFVLKANGEKFSVVVNHLKSKGSCPTVSSDPNADNGDGQGCWNELRKQQAHRLLGFLDTVKTTSGDPDVFAVGDFNSYGKEDPIGILEDGGLTNEIGRFVGPDAYSYVFDGLSGYLDHGLATESADKQVVGAGEWHINADEPSVIDYNTEFKNYGSETRYSPDLYEASPYRSSDHDPVLLGVELGKCQYADDENTRTRTLLGDCQTGHTQQVPDGWTLDGAGHTITAYDPSGDHFRGAVVANAGAVASVRNLTVTVAQLADVCDAGAVRLRGILLDGASGSVAGNKVLGIKQGAASGCQEGNGIEVRNTAGPATTVTVTGNEVRDYQKTGILADGAVQATITGNTVRGAGPVDHIAQNGVQVSRGASATVEVNTIAGNVYTPTTDVACGLLFYQPDAAPQRKNTFSGHEQDVGNVGRGGGNVTPAG